MSLLTTHPPIPPRARPDGEEDAAPSRKRPRPAEAALQAPRPPAAAASVYHPRSRYARAAPDFQRLARLDAAFAREVTFDPAGRVRVDWKSPAGLRALTAALLRHDFGLEVELPADRLCPSVPNRLDYLCHVCDLLEEFRGPEGGGGGAAAAATGLDIGVGASCVYPLLGHRAFGWRWFGSEVDAASLAAAQANARRNDLADAVKLVRVEPSLALQRSLFRQGDLGGGADPGPGPLRRALEALEAQGELPPQFCVCNPPFFRAGEDAPAQRDACTAAKTESETAGGEAAFVGAMIADSAALGPERGLLFYTAMIGVKANLGRLKDLLRARGVPWTRVLAMQQGRTRRWILAWSFRAPAPPRAGAAGTHTIEGVPAGLAFDELRDRLVEHLRRVVARDAGAEGAAGGVEVVSEPSGAVVRVGTDLELALRPPDDRGRFDIAGAGDKALFHKLLDGADGEVLRTNRRWRRLLKKKSAAETK